MGEFGHFSLALAWLLTIVAMLSAVLAGVKSSVRWLETSRNATLAAGGSGILALIALGYQFVVDDYTNQYVWQFSNREMATVYKISAIWGGMDGSMLLWSSVLGVCAALVAKDSLKFPRRLAPWTLFFINTAVFFFHTISFLLTNPFRYLKSSFIPPDGNGLNPLLQNPFMAIHPPMLYLGFTALAVPAAFCLAALVSKELSNEWIRLTRRWTLFAWGALTAGICLGGYWAYIELGWGGFWAWDPVENASFLPWLTATAFLHSVMVQERKNMLRFWNVWLVVGTYGLTVFGTFLTRSGVVQSVHAFASTDVGWVFLTYLGILFLVTAVLTWHRREYLRSERQLESLFSREAAFLLNNLVFLSICFATLWGVMFPVLSEAVTGKKQTVSIPFFNAVNVPLFLILIFLMGIGPLIAWKKANLRSMLKAFLWPAAIGVFSGFGLLWAGIEGFYPILSYALCVFVLCTILNEFQRGMKVQRAARREAQSGVAGDATRLFRRHTSRYGGYLIHFGVVVATIGITASMAHKVEKEFSLAVGEEYSVGSYSLKLEQVAQRRNKNYEAVYAFVSVSDSVSGDQFGALQPELRVYLRNSESTSEVAILKQFKGDLYLVLAGLDQDGARAVLKVFLNPLQSWLWIGVLIMLAGTVVVIMPRASKAVLRSHSVSSAGRQEI